ncbi:LacI family DNA-binding transcriptional regulator [Brachybacterium sp. AOP43-C2-M15]|uniref:LacI family DNA-binding transcriptional regulator n=1 Tax=Brachybacterium sp. AOP43-C2-M15 TaxID=3457661 RepID=UPI0040343675
MTARSRRPTSADVAALAGVSRATVSMVLNGRTAGTVAATTQQRVLEAAAELGYTRSAVAISLREQRTRTIGLITDEIATSPFAGRMARAASMAAARREYLVITVDLSLRDHSVSDAARLLAERQVDGLVYATMGRERVPLPQIPPGIPLVLLNCELEDDGDGASAPPTVVPDDYGGARRAARRLVETGHRRIVMLTGADGTVADVERQNGFRDELAAAGLTPRIVPTGWQMDDGYRETARLLAEEEPPTGLFCIRDRVAGGALQAAAVAGVEVPGGLSVIGFDDEDFFAERLTPALTTIALPHGEMGERAMSALLDLLEADGPEASGPDAGERDSAGPGMRWVAECPLVERDSVGLGPRG